MVGRSERATAIPHVILPLALVPVLLPRKYLAKPVPLILLPLTVVKVFVVVVTVALTFPQILLPLAMVLVIRPLLLVCAVENAIAVSNVSTFDHDLAFIMVAITVGVLAHDSMWVLLLLIS